MNTLLINMCPVCNQPGTLGVKAQSSDYTGPIIYQAACMNVCCPTMASFSGPSQGDVLARWNLYCARIKDDNCSALHYRPFVDSCFS